MYTIVNVEKSGHDHGHDTVIPEWTTISVDLDNHFTHPEAVETAECILKRMRNEGILKGEVRLVILKPAEYNIYQKSTDPSGHVKITEIKRRKDLKSLHVDFESRDDADIFLSRLGLEITFKHQPYVMDLALLLHK